MYVAATLFILPTVIVALLAGAAPPNAVPATVTVSPIVRSSQLNDVSVGSSVATRDNGVCPLRSTGRYHRVRVSVSGNFNTMSGVDVEATPEGKR